MYTRKVLCIVFGCGVALLATPADMVHARRDMMSWHEQIVEQVRTRVVRLEERFKERFEGRQEKIRERFERVEKRIERARDCMSRKRSECREGDVTPISEPQPEPEPEPNPDPLPDPEPEPDPDPVPNPDPVLPTVHLSPGNTAVQENTTTALVWDTQDADTCLASGALDWNGAVATTGMQMVTLSATTTYILECANEQGSTTASVEVGVVPAPADEDPEPEPEPGGTAPTLAFTATDILVGEGDTTTLGWTADSADLCLASGADDWQGVVAHSGTQIVTLTATTTYLLQCGNEFGTTSKSVEVEVELVPEEDPLPDPEPVTGKVLITEVLFDPGPTAVQGTEADNEWIEVYNGTNVAVDMMGWTIGDGVATDTISSVSLVVPAGEYLIISRYASTSDYWAFPDGTVFMALNATLGSNGLSNTGESAILYDATGAIVDAVSWGTVTLTMNPSVDIAMQTDGESIVRKNRTVDTDTATDWEVAVTPDPGA